MSDAALSEAAAGGERESATATDGALHMPSDRRRLPGAPERRREVALGVVVGLEAMTTLPSVEALLLAAVATLAQRYTHQGDFAIRVTRHGTSLQKKCDASFCFDADLDARSCIAQAQAALEQLQSNTVALRLAPAPGLSLHIFETATRTLRPSDGPDHLAAPLAFSCARGERGLLAWLAYDEGSFLDGTIARLIGHFQNVVRALLTGPTIRLSEITLLDERERAQLLVDWDSGKSARLPGLVHERVAEQAAQRPEAIAITFRDGDLSYGELERRANQLAHYLREQGVVPGDRVSVCVAPSFDIVVCLLGIFKVGAIHVPLDPTYPKDRLAVILEDTEPRVAISHVEFVSRLPLSPQTKQLLIDVELEALARRPADPLQVDVRPENVSHIIYTSGTTGVPKGVMTNHGNLAHFVRSAVDRYELCAADVVPSMARFTFSITMFEMFLPLVVGGRLIVLEREHVVDFKRLLHTFRAVTLVHAAPSLLKKLLVYMGERQLTGSALPRLRHLSSGGDFVSAELLEALKQTFAGVELFVIYGCTEIACMGCTYEVPLRSPIERSKVGKPFPDVRVRLLDPQGQLVPIGVTGEIYFAGAGITSGYFRRPELTAERYVTYEDERYYRTGDWGRFDASGDLEILGRSDFQVKLRGIRIELGDVEATLRRAPAVREAVVMARQPEGREEMLVAYVVPTAEGCDVPGIRRFMQSQLPDYMVPAVIVLLDALPVNMNQKLDRRALPEPVQADFARQSSHVPPRTPIEKQLLEIWRHVLRTEALGIRDAFFDAGGDSLLALPLMIEVERVFGVTLPMSALLTESTVERLAALIEDPMDKEFSGFVCLRAGGTKTPVFLVHDGDGETILYRQLANRLPEGHAVYGIQPYARGSHPILHTRLDDVARHYVGIVRTLQPHGPYALGGLCIGGFIAFEMAQLLVQAGERVDLVALIDVAHVTLPPKSSTKTRLKRFGSSLGGAPGRGRSARALQAIQLLRKKGGNVILHEFRSKTERVKNDFKMRILRFCLDRGLALPKIARDIPVRVALRFAEREYVMPSPYPGPIVLLRATVKDAAFDGTLIDDTPYVDQFDDPRLGWRGKSETLHVHDVPGGHSSMLQEPNVGEVARILTLYMNRERPLPIGDFLVKESFV